MTLESPRDSHMGGNGSQLAMNRLSFGWAARHAFRAAGKSRDASAMAWTDVAGRLTYTLHPGFFCSPALENMLTLIGGRHKPAASAGPSALAAIQQGEKHWLHVLTTALTVGGHTRLVEKWIANQRGISLDRHSVVLIDQGDHHCPEWLSKAVEATGGKCIVLPDGMDLLRRAMALRDLANGCAKIVVLHIHPFDPVASVAFAVEGGPPVVTLNHADHVFWYGSAVSDLVADIRPEGQRTSLDRRRIKRSELLPIPLRRTETPLSRAEFRKKLEIPEDRIVLLSVGTSYKYKPYGLLNFPDAMLKMVERDPDLLCIVIGPSPAEPAWERVVAQSKGAIRVLGIVRDIVGYYCAADIYLEGFPFGSITASLDSVLVGTPVVRAPMLLTPLLGLGQYQGMNETAGSIEAYQAQVSSYVKDRAFREAAASRQRAAVESIHAGAGWNAYFSRLLECVPLNHEPQSCLDEGPDTGFQDQDKAWADLQAGQFSSPGENWRVCSASLRANAKNFSKGEMIEGLWSCPDWHGITFSGENAVEFIKFFLMILCPGWIYRRVLDRRAAPGRWLRGRP